MKKFFVIVPILLSAVFVSCSHSGEKEKQAVNQNSGAANTGTVKKLTEDSIHSSVQDPTKESIN